MTNILETKNLVKSFGGVHAVDHLSISIPEGQIVGLVGPNGSGKTTLINVLSRFMAYDKGEIILNGTITRTFQQIRLFDQMSVLDNILVILTERSPIRALFEKHTELHLHKAEEILKKIDLHEKRHHNAGDLSYGQRKLLEIGRALAMESKIVLLDEPFAGLFPEIIKKVESLVKELRDNGKTVVLVEHNMNIIRNLCDYLIVMDAGKLLAEGKPEEVLARRDVLEAYLGE